MDGQQYVEAEDNHSPIPVSNRFSVAMDHIITTSFRAVIVYVSFPYYAENFYENERMNEYCVFYISF